MAIARLNMKMDAMMKEMKALREEVKAVKDMVQEVGEVNENELEDGIVGEKPGNKTGNVKDPKARALPDRVPQDYALGKPYMCGSYNVSAGRFHDTLCFCNGDVYMGKLYASGKPGSGAIASFKQMTEGGCKGYSWKYRNQTTGCKKRPYETLKKSNCGGSPGGQCQKGWSWIKCGGCFSWVTNGNYLRGYDKQCICVPKKPIPPTPAPPPTNAPMTPPPPGKRAPKWE